MSFVKIPRKYSSKVQGVKKKRRPGWDDTIQDLSVHKASKEELERRKEVAISQNMDLVKADKVKRNISRASRTSKMTGKKKQSALLREVLYDNSELYDVLNKTDHMMSVVRDLFGDDPVKYRGLPNVTTAPNYSGRNHTALPEDSHAKKPLKLDILSDSIMDKSAINESDDYSSDSEELDDSVDAPSYQTKIDFDRFQQLLAQADVELEKEKHKNQTQMNRNSTTAVDRLLEEISSKLGVKAISERNRNVTPPAQNTPTCDTSDPNGAMNDTVKVNKTKSRLTKEEHLESAASVNTSQPEETEYSTLQDLGQVLQGLEKNIVEYEDMTGRQSGASTLKHSTEESSTLTGFTARLVTALNKVSKYLKENELRIRAESMLREQLSEDVVCFKTLVDTLTSDIIATQEQFVSLQSEFLKYKKETSEEISAIKYGLSIRGIQLHPFVAPAAQYPPVQALHTVNNTEDVHRLHQSELNNQSQSQTLKNAQVSSHLEACLSSALPLSVPRQTNSSKVSGKPFNRKSRNQGESGFDQPSALRSLPNTEHEELGSSYIIPHAVMSEPALVQSNQPIAVKAVYPNQSATDLHNSLNNGLVIRNRLENSLNGSAFQPLKNSTTGEKISQQGGGDNQVDELSAGSITQKLDTAINQFHDFPVVSQVQKNPENYLLPNSSLINNITNYSLLPSNNPQQSTHQSIQSAVGKNFMTIQDNDAVAEEDSSLQKQIEELHKQHAEAQDKLALLFHQQQNVDKKLATKNVSVSPSISPITVDSDVENQFPHASSAQLYKKSAEKRQEQPRRIQVAMPRVENIIQLQT